MIQNSIKIVKSCVIWYIFRWAGGRVTRGGCVDGWVGGISIRTDFHNFRHLVPINLNSGGSVTCALKNWYDGLPAWSRKAG